MQFYHPLNTPGLTRVHMAVPVASPQMRIKHFLVPRGTTVPTINLLTTEAKEKDLSTFPNLCF